MSATALARSAQGWRPIAASAHTLPAPRSPYVRPRTVLGDPTPLACTVAKTALEAVLGEPSVDKLTRWVSPQIRSALAQQHSLARRAGRELLCPVRIERVRVCRVTATAAEVSVVAHDGQRTRAIAMRVEDVRGRWLTTVLEIG